MSDPFLVLMCEDLPLSRDLARALLLSDKEADDILEISCLHHDGITVMKVA